MMITEIMEVILYVQDMQAQVRFYRDMLGLAVSYPQALDSYQDQTWVTFASGACTLALHGGGQRRQGKDTPMVVFRVADIQSARQTLVAQGVTVGEIFTAAPGVQVCHFQDPEGNPLALEIHH
jgi:predicted enzyme related to lactoylglutathione lyase